MSDLYADTCVTDVYSRGSRCHGDWRAVWATMAKRKHDPEYVTYGFPYIEDKKGLRPRCVVRSEVLAQEGVKPSTLKRHD